MCPAIYYHTEGADKAIDCTTEDVYGVLGKLTDYRGVDYVLNTINSESATKDPDVLVFGGELVFTAGFPGFSCFKFDFVARNGCWCGTSHSN